MQVTQNVCIFPFRDWRVYLAYPPENYKDKVLRSVYNLFQEGAKITCSIINHTLLDKVHWERYLNETDPAVIWMDYSQNIKLVEKNQ